MPNLQITITASWVSVIALCVSATALLFTAKNYRRKAGIFIRGGFSIGSSVASEDNFVTAVMLENLKDRAVTIFAIYLKIGHNYYVELEDFTKEPVILKAYETYRKEYGPIEFYGINMSKIDLNALLTSSKVKKRLVLSTSEGKYNVPRFRRHWNPVGDFFRNHMTAIVRPVCTLHKGKYVGRNVKYIVEFVADNGNEEIVLINPRDYELKIFKNFRLTKESLESKDALERLFQQQFDMGKLNCKKFTVIDPKEWRERKNEFYSDKTIVATYYSAFQYHFTGRFLTGYSNWKMGRANALKNQPKRLHDS